MSTCKNTAPAIRPQDDTHHEGTQLALDVMFSRQSALNQRFNEAFARHDNRALFDLDVRLAEVGGIISALRAGGTAWRAAA